MFDFPVFIVLFVVVVVVFPLLSIPSRAVLNSGSWEMSRWFCFLKTEVVLICDIIQKSDYSDGECVGLFSVARTKHSR